MTDIFPVRDSRPAMGETQVNKDGCINPDLNQGQAFGRTTFQVGEQTYADSASISAVTGRSSWFCGITLFFAVLYAGLAIWVAIFAQDGTDFVLFSSGVDSFGQPAPVADHTVYLPWFTLAFLGAIAIIYGGVALIGGTDYFARHIFARGEAVTGPATLLLHMVMNGFITFLWTKFQYRDQFYMLTLGVALIVVAGYAAITHETSMERGWTFLTIIGFVAATGGNLLQWAHLAYVLFYESISTWVLFIVLAYILFNAAYWLNFLAWILGWGKYSSSPKAIRSRYDIFGMVSIGILAAQTLVIMILYILNDLQ